MGGGGVMSTEQQTETRQGIARGIAKRYTREGTGYADRLYQLAYAIEAALKDRDERAVRIIRKHRESDVCKDNCWTMISDAIRNEGNK